MGKTAQELFALAWALLDYCSSPEFDPKEFGNRLDTFNLHYKRCREQGEYHHLFTQAMKGYRHVGGVTGGGLP